MKTQFLFILTLLPTTAFAVRGQKPPYSPDVIYPPVTKCHAPGPDQCWDATGRGRYKWVCDHCETVKEFQTKDPCVLEFHNLAKQFDSLNTGKINYGGGTPVGLPSQGLPGGPISVACQIPTGTGDRKYPDLPNFANGFDSVAGAYDEAVQSSSDAESASASLAATANNPTARICAVAKAVNEKAVAAEDKLVDADANLEFVKEYDRIGKAIDAGTNALVAKPACVPTVEHMKQLKQQYLLIGRRCIGTTYAKKVAGVKASKKQIASLKKTLKDQCLREQSLDNSSAQNPAANESESTISEAK